MTTYLDIDPQKWAFALSSGVMIVILIYGIVWINTLMKIWHTQFQDPREKMFWFFLVLFLSPIAMPVYLLMSAGRAKTTDATIDDKPRPGHQTPEARYNPADAGMSDASKERELARLLQMKKNGILSSEQFDKAKKRLQ
jgi:hypothetical protein